MDGARKIFEGCLIYPASRYTHMAIAIAATSGKIISGSFNITEAVIIAMMNAKLMIYERMVTFFETDESMLICSFCLYYFHYKVFIISSNQIEINNDANDISQLSQLNVRQYPSNNWENSNFGSVKVFV